MFGRNPSRAQLQRGGLPGGVTLGKCEEINSIVDSTHDAVKTRVMGSYGLREDRKMLMFPKTKNKTTANKRNKTKIYFQDNIQISHFLPGSGGACL